jgi:hypothetical protein
VLVELHLRRVNHDVGARQFSQLAQLGIGERCLRRATAAEQKRLPDRGP